MTTEKGKVKTKPKRENWMYSWSPSDDEKLKKQKVKKGR